MSAPPDVPSRRSSSPVGEGGALFYEQIDYDPTEPLRFLRWCGSLDEAEAIEGSGRVVPFPGAGQRWHYHPALEITLMKEGRGNCVIGNHLNRFSAPDLVLFGPNLPHCWLGEGRSEGICLQVDLSAPAFAALPGMPAVQALWGRLRHGVRLYGESRERLAAQLSAFAGLSSIRRVALFWEVIAQLSEAPVEEQTVISSHDFQGVGESPYARQMQAAVHWIIDRACTGQPEIVELLTAIGMSRATFARHFRQHTGHSFGEFVQEVRMMQARRLLAESQAKVVEVAYQCGFGSLASFNRAFLAAEGCSPTSYRARCRGRD